MKSTTQAFPYIHINNNGSQNSVSGMTLRDYIATKVLAGLVSFSHDENLPNSQSIEYNVMLSVKAADLLLKELDK